MSDEQLQILADELKATYGVDQLAKLARLIEPTPSTGTMSSDDFDNMMNVLDVTSSRRGYSPKSREAARLIFVMGANDSEASVETGLTVQAVNQLVKRIRSRMGNMPKGWVAISVGLPNEVAKQVKTLSQKLLSAHHEGRALDGNYSIVLDSGI